MILSKVYEDAEHRLERNEITLGEFERLVDIEVIEPKRGEWIPCSERMPNNDDEMVLVSGDEEALEYPCIITKAKYMKYWYSQGVRKLAWMPLPKPYGEREGE